MNRMQKKYEAIDFPPLTEDQKSDLQKLEVMEESQIQTDDIPECNGNGGFYYMQEPKVKKTEVC